MSERKRHGRAGDDPLRAADSAAGGGLHMPPFGVDPSSADASDTHDAGDLGAGRGAPGQGDAALGAMDPDLQDNLGAELPLRGDMLEAQLELARNEAVEWRDKAMRAQAEYENTRKRLEARHSDAVLRAGERVVESLIPVIDDFERAAAHVAAENAELAEGIFAVERKLLGVLGKEGVSAIDPMGEAFDPNRHSAVQMREDATIPDHTVVEVYQKGFEMHGRVLRPAMVVVSTGGPARG